MRWRERAVVIVLAGQFTLLRVVLALAMTAIGIRLLQTIFRRGTVRE